MRTLIAANWKMHGRKDWVNKLENFNEILPYQDRLKTLVLICPPYPYIQPLRAMAEKVNVSLGAQNCHAEESGAHTGEVSAGMLQDCGARFVIVGHSERRATGESDDDVRAKAEAAHRETLIPIICVGEPLEVRKAGEAEQFVETQLLASLPEDKTDVVIAYEPIWAIGTGLTPSLDEIDAMHSHIRGLVGDTVRILYGGSVKPANAEDILAIPDVNGALIGGASLDMDSLAAITRAAP